MSEKLWKVYKHTNKINGKSYIGITSNSVEKRWGKNGQGYNPYHRQRNLLYDAIQKYGWDNFEHEIIKNDLCFEDACKLEQYYIKKYNTKAPYGYNLTLGGEGTLGVSVSKTERKRRSKRMSGGNNITAKQIIYGDKIFDTIEDCAKYLNVNRNKIVRWITGETIIPKIHYQNKLQFVGEKPNYKLKRKPPHKNTVSVLYNGVVYNSIKELSEVIKINRHTLSGWLRGTYGVSKQYQYLLNTDLSIVGKPNKLRLPKSKVRN